MTPERWHKVKEVFDSALELQSEERPAFVQQALGHDQDLSDEVQSLLASYEAEDNFMEVPAIATVAESLAEDPVGIVGQRIGPYQIIRDLGRGGMGDVYLAQDQRLRRPVALKLLPQHFTIDVERVRRFQQEAHSASALNHPNIVTIYEIGRIDSIHYIATEFIEGMTLRDRITSAAPPTGNGAPVAGAPLELSEALDIAIQIASGLMAAHAAGIVHRDIKPENVMIRRDGFVKLLDFGIAKLTTGELTKAKPTPTSSHTNPGMVMGTVQYMSPEQARGQEVDPRTDIWSLGVVLYEMVSGRVPFARETPSHMIVSILESEPPSLGDDSDLSKELKEIIRKALRKKKDERYASANELALELKELRRKLEIDTRLNQYRVQYENGGQKQIEKTKQSAAHTDIGTARATSSTESLINGIKSHKRAALFSATAMLLALTIVGYSFYQGRGGHIASSAEPINSIAILPFVNESADPNTEYLAYGISNSVINSLSRLPKLRVISLNAVLRYKRTQTDPRSVGRDLNVRAVLMGRVMQREDTLSISTELIDVRDNSRLWGEQYNRKLSNILQVQEEIARKISYGLRLQLTGEEKKQLEKRYTQNSRAYLFYSVGNYHFLRNTKEGFEESIEYYDKAIKFDPKYALAYTGLAKAYWALQWRGFWIPKEGWRRSEWAAMKAVECDETLAEAHVALAGAKRHGDWAGSEAEYLRALELDANSVEANQDYATYLAFSGRADEAFVYAKRADEIDERVSGSNRAYLPFIHFLARQYDTAIEGYQKALEKAPKNPQFHFFLGEAYVAKGMYEEGIAELQKAVDLDDAPERWDRYPMLAYAYGVSGRRDEALKILSEQKRLAKQRYISPYNFAIIYTGLGDKDRAFEYLKKVLDDGSPLRHLQNRPMFDSLRSDPRYTELIQSLGRAQ